MIEVLEAADHVLAWKVSGTLNAEDYDRLIAATEAKLAAHPKVGVYADMSGFTDMTAEAMLKDIRYDLSKIRQWSRFPRLAMVTDKAWLRMMVTVADPFFPQFEAKVFEPGEKAQALAWASDIPRS